MRDDSRSWTKKRINVVYRPANSVQTRQSASQTLFPFLHCTGRAVSQDTKKMRSRHLISLQHVKTKITRAKEQLSRLDNKFSWLNQMQFNAFNCECWWV
jgi:hypothetical protein